MRTVTVNNMGTRQHDDPKTLQAIEQQTMNRSTFLRFGDDVDDDSTAVKVEPAANAPVGMAAPQGRKNASQRPSLVTPAVLPSSAAAASKPVKKQRADDSVDAVKVEAGGAVAGCEDGEAAGRGPPRHQCPHCEYGTENKSHITVHARTHTGEKPFKVRGSDTSSLC